MQLHLPGLPLEGVDVCLVRKAMLLILKLPDLSSGHPKAEERKHSLNMHGSVGIYFNQSISINLFSVHRTYFSRDTTAFPFQLPATFNHLASPKSDGRP